MGVKKMPLFDPTFYENEQQDIKETERPREKNNVIWYFIGGSILTAIIISIGVLTGVII